MHGFQIQYRLSDHSIVPADSLTEKPHRITNNFSNVKLCRNPISLLKNKPK